MADEAKENFLAELAQIQAGRLDLNIGKVNLSRETKAVVSDFQPPVFEKNQTLEYEPSSQDLMVKADPDRVREILMNLISNAIKFTSANGKITISYRPSLAEIITDVKDTGVGIKAEEQADIFAKGEHLGLALAKALAEVQGGRMWLEYSEVGKGSAFSFALPRVKK